MLNSWVCFEICCWARPSSNEGLESQVLISEVRREWNVGIHALEEVACCLRLCVVVATDDAMGDRKVAGET